MLHRFYTQLDLGERARLHARSSMGASTAWHAFNATTAPFAFNHIPLLLMCMHALPHHSHC